MNCFAEFDRYLPELHPGKPNDRTSPIPNRNPNKFQKYQEKAKTSFGHLSFLTLYLKICLEFRIEI